MHSNATRLRVIRELNHRPVIIQSERKRLRLVARGSDKRPARVVIVVARAVPAGLVNRFTRMFFNFFLLLRFIYFFPVLHEKNVAHTVVMRLLRRTYRNNIVAQQQLVARS